MAIFTKQFADHDDYEEWLEHASDRINVLSIGNPPTHFWVVDREARRTGNCKVPDPRQVACSAKGP